MNCRLKECTGGAEVQSWMSCALRLLSADCASLVERSLTLVAGPLAQVEKVAYGLRVEPSAGLRTPTSISPCSSS